MSIRHLIVIAVMLSPLFLASTAGTILPSQETPDEVLLGDDILFSVEAEGIREVFVEYTFHGTVHNHSMHRQEGLFIFSISHVWTSGLLEYEIVTLDIGGRWNRTPVRYVHVRDNGGWALSRHTPVPNPICKTKGTPVSVSFPYHIEPLSVHLHYTDARNRTHRVATARDEGSWTSFIPPQERSGVIEYRFQAEYDNGPFFSSETYRLMLNSSIRADFREHRGSTKESMDFRIGLHSPVGIRNAVLHYTENGVPTTKPLMPLYDEPDTWGLRLELEEGIYHYHVSVEDLNGDREVIASTEAILIEKKTGLMGAPLYFVLLLMVWIPIGIIIMKRKPDAKTEIVEEIGETRQVNNDTCIICFESLGKRAHVCGRCGERYHPSCIKQLGECPGCGKRPTGVDRG